jgi:hypothetical protein
LIDPFTNISKNICIVGIPKCGTVSLETYLKERFPDKEVRRIEQIWKGKEGIEKALDKFPDWHYVIILRDNSERIWSNYYFFQMNKTMTLEEYLNFHSDIFKRLGESNPIKQGNYGHWLKIWSKVNPIIITLEDAKQLENFPHENKTGDKKTYPEMTEVDRKLITSYLERENDIE